MATYQELTSQIAALMQQADAARKTEIAAVVAEIRSKMSEFGLTAADLGTTTGSRKTGAPVAVKYRNQATGDTWTGRGKMPRWLVAQVAEGKSKEDFAV